MGTMLKIEMSEGVAVPCNLERPETCATESVIVTPQSIKISNNRKNAKTDKSREEELPERFIK